MIELKSKTELICYMTDLRNPAVLNKSNHGVHVVVVVVLYLLSLLVVSRLKHNNFAV